MFIHRSKNEPLIYADNSRQMEQSPPERVLHKKQKEIMNVENTKAQMRKGVLEYCILSILNGQDKYASEILDTLKDAKMLVVEGTIYPLLTRLKKCRASKLPLGRIYFWTTKKILYINRNR